MSGGAVVYELRVYIYVCMHIRAAVVDCWVYYECRVYIHVCPHIMCGRAVGIRFTKLHIYLNICIYVYMYGYVHELYM